MYQLVFYVPGEYVEKVKSALFNAGAGRIGEYEQCCWQTPGSGQFRPLAASSPFIGSVNQLQSVEEYKVEMVCEKKLIKAVLTALISSHPYETAAYSVFEMKTIEDF
ncbi:NGG1p interacting factor 3 protein, NIF3 [Psychromonas aquimarina]|uniref:NGG1p interacting factor 3 protein, NIF3 n=1 Tax=Psychromonas aquimarina TaxID=444919 RepID=UPI000403C2C8|nr:NGG1p interacting factor 3 protein, NIF3 [Psychromonas aquimarina]